MARTRGWFRRRPRFATATLEITTADLRAVREQAEVAPELASLEVREREESLTSQIADRKLKQTYGLSLLIGLGLQLTVANLIFLGYAAWGVDWKIDRYVMSVWLTATLVEVIAVVTVVTKSLFPPPP